MKYLKTLSIGVLLFTAFQAKAQINQDTTLKNPDKPTKCKNIKEGKFLRDNYPESIWYMTVKDNVQTEYFNNGKDYIKSSLVFLDDCSYKAVVIEKTDQSDPTKIGDTVDNKILQTEKNFLRISSTFDKQVFEKILIKIK
jgi:hypothetical protein